MKDEKFKKILKSAAYLVFYSVLIALSFKSFDVSMNEPFTKITFNEIKWQYLIPSAILTLSLSHVCINFAAVWQGKRS